MLIPVFSPACALLLLAPAAIAPDSVPVLAVKSGTTIEKTIEVKVDMTGKTVRLKLGDEELDAGALGDDGFRWTDDTKMVIEDTYVMVADGRATKLSRSFKELEERTKNEPKGDDAEPATDEELESALVGKKVIFAWDDEDSKYTPAFDKEHAGDDALLEGLDADLDFVAFLPTKKVAEGDTWTVEAKACVVLIAPGGDLSFQEEGGDAEDARSQAELTREFSANLKGKAQMTYKGTRKVDDRELYVLALEAELESTGDTADDEGNAVYTETFVFEGEILWDREAGHARSVDLKAKVETKIVFKSKLETEDGASIELENEVLLTGEQTLSAKFE